MDRNIDGIKERMSGLLSLSARRAWIEIAASGCVPSASGSLSARRAWIEMATSARLPAVPVSLSARRAWIEIDGTRTALCGWTRRSPQGERG